MPKRSRHASTHAHNTGRTDAPADDTPEGRATNDYAVSEAQRKLAFILRHQLRARASLSMPWSQLQGMVARE